MHVGQLTYVYRLAKSFSLLCEGGWGEHSCCLAGNLAVSHGSPSGTTCVSCVVGPGT